MTMRSKPFSFVAESSWPDDDIVCYCGWDAVVFLMLQLEWTKRYLLRIAFPCSTDFNTINKLFIIGQSVSTSEPAKVGQPARLP